MANEIRTKLDAWDTFTLLLAPGGVGLAAGSARQSTMEPNASLRPAALTLFRISPGAAPTAGTVYEIFLLRGDDAANRTDLAGASDAAITIVNAQLIGTLVNPGSTTDVEDLFDTAPHGPLGTEWGVAIRNSTNQSLDTTEANHIKKFATYLPEIQ